MQYNGIPSTQKTQNKTKNCFSLYKTVNTLCTVRIIYVHVYVHTLNKIALYNHFTLYESLLGSCWVGCWYPIPCIYTLLECHGYINGMLLQQQKQQQQDKQQHAMQQFATSISILL